MDRSSSRDGRGAASCGAPVGMSRSRRLVLVLDGGLHLGRHVGRDRRPLLRRLGVLRALVRAGKTTVLVPIGGTEQNGPHMALGKHNVRVRLLAEQVAHGLGNALVAPVLAYVPEGAVEPPAGHMRFPGTITVREETFRQTLESAARSFRAHGFRDIVFLGDHGSTQAGQRAVAARLNQEWTASPVRVHAVEEDYRTATAGFEALLKPRVYRADESGQHARRGDTSLT